MKKLITHPDNCSGCRLCELVCSEYHEDEINPLLSRVKIKKNEATGVDKPLICRQCNSAACAKACPEEAITRIEETGVWEVDTDKCTGCGLCVEACPFDAMYLNDTTHIAYKCDYCGGEPRCAQVCELQALEWVEKKRNG